MPSPLPYPVPWSTPLRPPGLGDALDPPGGSKPRVVPSLIPAVAAVVAIAAERTRASGELHALRDAIEAVLDKAAREGR
ncbi:hypothetical protein DFH01_16730 [Falsiroseomonas bella]|uniref:Uncharacterized protein n=1 Tax=Falsiroseomonas bella TaxID=2184016 RepID=A0A317FE06_9PROT|nr:hypothetical protein [Falsiroseomonas bella]PWS36773.1 hypothetical protein DFH01_16730 [Falsiroseomonas bella]